MKLYELTDQYAELAKLAESADEADQKAFADTLEGLTGEIEDKVLNCAAVAKGLQAEADALAGEMKRLGDRRKALENSADRLKQYMGDGMTALGMDRVKGNLFTVAFQNNAPSVVLDVPDEQLPVGYFRTKIEADKKLIAERLKAGEVLAFAHLEQGRSLRIR